MSATFEICLPCPAVLLDFLVFYRYFLYIHACKHTHTYIGMGMCTLESASFSELSSFCYQTNVRK